MNQNQTKSVILWLISGSLILTLQYGVLHVQIKIPPLLVWNSEFLFMLLDVFCSGGSCCFHETTPSALSHLFNIKTKQSFWHYNKPKENRRRITSMVETSEKRTIFPSNLLHHIPKIQWIRPYTPELTIILETVGAWNISYHLHFISAIHAKLSHLGFFIEDFSAVHTCRCFISKVAIFTLKISGIKSEQVQIHPDEKEDGSQ